MTGLNKQSTTTHLKGVHSFAPDQYEATKNRRKTERGLISPIDQLSSQFEMYENQQSGETGMIKTVRVN